MDQCCGYKSELSECISEELSGRFLCSDTGLQKHSQAFCLPEWKHLRIHCTARVDKEDKEGKSPCDGRTHLRVFLPLVLTKQKLGLPLIYQSMLFCSVG